MKLKAVLVVLTVGALFLAACGDSSGGSDADPALVSALAEAMSEPDADGDPGLLPIDDATCASEKIISGIGTDRLLELGVDADNVPELDEVGFTTSEADTVVDAMGDCSDLPRIFADRLTDDGTLTAAEADCFAGEFKESDLLDVFRVLIDDADADPPDSFLQTFLDVAAECNFSFG